MNQIDTTVYEVAHSQAVLVDRSALGMLKVTGKTRLDLIDRMSTQRVKQLQSGEGAATILTTDIGRFIDRLILYAGSDAVYALTGEGNGDAVARYLMGYVFFNDDFQLQDVTAETAVFGIYGPKAGPMLAAAGFPSSDLPLHHWRTVDFNGVTAYLHRTDPIAGDGYLVTCQDADREAVWNGLQAAGLVVADAAAFTALRVESGMPQYGAEITGDYIPLETGLWDDVSFNKGCYIGQEIIARMESRGKLAKQLVQLRAPQPLPAAAPVLADGKTVGSVTSTAVLPKGSVALAYVKTSALEADTLLTVGETAVSLAA